jgi:hypothetical protein
MVKDTMKGYVQMRTRGVQSVQDNQGVGILVLVEAKSFSSPHHPDQFRDPLSHPSNGYWGLFPVGLSGQGVKLTIHLFSIHLYGIVLN